MSIQPKWFSLFWFTLSLYLYLQLMVMKASNAALVVDCTLSSCWRFVATIKRWSHFWFCLLQLKICRSELYSSMTELLSTAAVVSVGWIYSLRLNIQPVNDVIDCLRRPSSLSVEYTLAMLVECRCLRRFHWRRQRCQMIDIDVELWSWRYDVMRLFVQ